MTCNEDLWHTIAQTVRIESPLVIAKEQIDILLDRLGDALKEINAAM